MLLDAGKLVRTAVDVEQPCLTFSSDQANRTLNLSTHNFSASAAPCLGPVYGLSYKELPTFLSIHSKVIPPKICIAVGSGAKPEVADAGL